MMGSPSQGMDGVWIYGVGRSGVASVGFSCAIKSASSDHCGDWLLFVYIEGVLYEDACLRSEYGNSVLI